MQKKADKILIAVIFTMMTAAAEMVMVAPTRLIDESDVALERAVDSVKEAPADTVRAVRDTASYIQDEFRNLQNGIASVYADPAPREVLHGEKLEEVRSAWNQKMQMKAYTVSVTVGSELANGAKTGPVDVREFFKDVDFPEGSSAWYRPETRRLIVCHSPDRLLAIQDMLMRCHKAESEYKQVEIQAKFIEVSQQTLNQLGFNWEINDVIGADGVRLFDSWAVNDNQASVSEGLRSATAALNGAPVAGSIALTKTGWMPLSVVISALEQSDDADVLSSPSLTTMDGKSASIWVGDRRNVPRKFSVQTEDSNVHIEHNDWDSQLMGVQFHVTPYMEKGDHIRLELNPKVIDLIGYDTYEVSPEASMLMVNGGSVEQTGVDGAYPILNVPAAGVTKVWDLMSATVGGDVNDATVTGTIGNNPTVYSDKERPADHQSYGVPLAAVQGRLPYFRVREIKTEVVVADGNTVGLGGLIYDRLETYKDKVPVLGSIPLVGRLFRSEGERRMKRNLMVFVSATQVDGSGQRKAGLVAGN